MEQIFRELAELKRRLAELETQETPGIWTNWTPTVTQSGSVTVTVTYARYFTDGKLVHLIASLAVTGTGTANNAIVIAGIPSAIAPANTGFAVCGTIDIQDSGTAQYIGVLIAVGANDLRGTAHNAGGTYIGAGPNFALANGDIISFQATYERA